MHALAHHLHRLVDSCLALSYLMIHAEAYAGISEPELSFFSERPFGGDTAWFDQPTAVQNQSLGTHIESAYSVVTSQPCILRTLLLHVLTQQLILDVAYLLTLDCNAL